MPALHRQLKHVSRQMTNLLSSRELHLLWTATLLCPLKCCWLRIRCQLAWRKSPACVLLLIGMCGAVYAALAADSAPQPSSSAGEACISGRLESAA